MDNVPWLTDTVRCRDADASKNSDMSRKMLALNQWWWGILKIQKHMNINCETQIVYLINKSRFRIETDAKSITFSSSCYRHKATKTQHSQY